MAAESLTVNKQGEVTSWREREGSEVVTGYDFAAVDWWGIRRWWVSGLSSGTFCGPDT